MSVTFVLVAALVLDVLLGEPRRFHPLVGFGHVVQRLEQYCYGNSRSHGVVALLLSVAPVVALTWIAERLVRGIPGGIPWWVVLDAVLLYVALGWTSLHRHALAVHGALVEHDLERARREVGRMVSRDADALDEEGVSRAAVESVLENGNDAVFGAVFWYLLAGAPGVVLYRLVNTLDAMWGYRNDRYLYFGWAAARLDDLLNVIPARLTALGYAINGRLQGACRCWRAQSASWKSRNAGVVMAAGAGSLGVRLGGPERYHGALQLRPVLGEGRHPGAADIDRALLLVRCTLFLSLLLVVLGGWIVERFLAG